MGSTIREKEVLGLLAETYSKFTELSNFEPQDELIDKTDTEDFKHCIISAQRIIASKIARRVDSIES